MKNLLLIVNCILVASIFAFGCANLGRITDFTDPENESHEPRYCKVKYEVTTTSNNYKSDRIFYSKNARGNLVFLYDQILPWTQEIEMLVQKNSVVSFAASIFSFQGTLTISIYVDDKKVFTKNGTYDLSKSNELLDARVSAFPIGFCYED